MPVAKTKAKPKTAGREEEAPRMGHNQGPEMRAPIRDDIPRNRAGDPVRLQFTGAEDKFAFDKSIIPSGWDYQWKTRTVKGWEWVDHLVELAQNGWEPVPPQRHDGVFMPKGYKGPTIERLGMILMERDMRLTLQARGMEKKEANTAVQNSRYMSEMFARDLSDGARDTVETAHRAAKQFTGVNVERQARQQQSNYQYDPHYEDLGDTVQNYEYTKGGR